MGFTLWKRCLESKIEKEEEESYKMCMPKIHSNMHTRGYDGIYLREQMQEAVMRYVRRYSNVWSRKPLFV